MTELRIGTVDVYVIRADLPSWRVFVGRRSADTRCPGAWETVHGRIEPGETPEDAAVREVREETGLPVDRLYSITVQPFYLPPARTVQLAVVFAAFVREPATVTLGSEHETFEWLNVEDALERFQWPREREAMKQVKALLEGGDAGAVEDVLRIL